MNKFIVYERYVAVVCSYLNHQRNTDIFEVVPLRTVAHFGVSPFFFLKKMSHFVLLEKPLLKWDEGEIFICLDSPRRDLLEYPTIMSSSQYSEDYHHFYFWVNKNMLFLGFQSLVNLLKGRYIILRRDKDYCS